MKDKYPRITVRMSKKLIKRIDRLQKKLMKKVPSINSRSACIKFLIDEGLDVYDR